MALSKAKILSLLQDTLIKFYTDVFKPDLDGHTHSYAGSSSVGGSATSANKVNNKLTLQLNGTTSKTFDGSSAQTFNVTPSGIGAAASSHGTHVTYSTTTPKANGTATIGTESTVARGDHVHPLQTSVSGNAGSANKVNNALTIQGNGTTLATFNGSAAKTVNITPSNIGASDSSHTHSYLPLSGGTLTGKLILNSNSGINMANGTNLNGTTSSGTVLTLATLTPIDLVRFGTTELETYISSSDDIRLIKNYDSSSTDGYAGIKVRNIYFRNTLDESVNHIGKIETDSRTGAVAISSQKALTLQGYSTYTDSTNCALEYKRITNSGESYPVLRPLTTGLARLGSSSLRWNTIYTTVAVNVSSDRRLKEDIECIDEKLENMFMDLKPVTYRLKENDDHRRHNGFIAQEVEDVMNKYNISYDDFAGLNKEKPDEDANNVFYNEDGKVDYEYGLRYSEFIALNTHMIQKQAKEIELLKQEIEDLKQKVNYTA